MTTDKLPADLGSNWRTAQNRWGILRGLFPLASSLIGDSVKELFPQLSSSRNVILLFGGVTKAGTIKTGTGFTCEKTATGKYTVKFTKALKAEAVVLITVKEAGTLRYPTLATSSTTEFKVEFTNQVLAMEDTEFNFVVLG